MTFLFLIYLSKFSELSGTDSSGNANVFKHPNLNWKILTECAVYGLYEKMLQMNHAKPVIVIILESKEYLSTTQHKKECI